MKQIFTSILLIAAAQGNAQTITWGTPVTVSSGTTSNLHPRIQLNRAGNPLVLWGKMDANTYFSKWTGSSFTSPLQVNPAAINTFAQSWAGPDLASFGDTIYVAMKHTPENINTNYAYLAHSYDGGNTFSAPVRVDNIDTNMSRFPIVTTTATGNPLVAFMKFNAAFNDAHYVVSRSTDFGMTFTGDALASGASGTVCDCCPASIISAGGKAIMLFRNNLSNIRDIWAGVSSDGGATFSSHMATDNTNWMIMSCPASGPDGFVIGDTVYSTFMSAGTGTSLVYLNKASISSGTAASTVPLTGSGSGISLQNYPRIANAGSAATAIWKHVQGGMNMLCFSFTSNIANGFSGYDTLAMGSGLANADVAMTPGNIHVVYEDDNTGKLMYVKGTYPIASAAVNTVTSSKQITVYPNPATESFSISLDKITTIATCALTDVTGRQTIIQPAIKKGVATFSLNGFAKGNYYFTLTDENGAQYHSQLVIE